MILSRESEKKTNLNEALDQNLELRLIDKKEKKKRPYLISKKVPRAGGWILKG